jgi:hypothetical protein
MAGIIHRCAALMPVAAAVAYATTASNASGESAQAPPQAQSQPEWKRTNPDIVVYVPKGEAYHDTDNEHFLVFPSPAGDELLAVWTQSSCEGRGDNRIMFARSRNATDWSTPVQIAGRPPGVKGGQASWGFPVVTKQGRIYVFFTKQTSRTDSNPQGCGTMGCLYSDDIGKSWTTGSDVPMPRNEFDHADPAEPKHWIVWQRPIRDRKGRLIAGYTQSTSPSHYGDKKVPWYGWAARCQFMRFDNIDDTPDPVDLKITWLPRDPRGLEVKHPNYDWSSSQEPSLVLLPDGRLFCVMRTWTGQIWYSVSADDGATWRPTEVLRYKDGGEPVEHPLAPCPIYALKDGRYLLLFHNNNGERDGYSEREKKWKRNYLNFLRNPAFLAVGAYRPGAHQPIWFSRPKQFADTQGVPIGPKGTAEVATYTSLTEWRGERILWYPDRKYHLLGKRVTDAWLADMSVPSVQP